MPKLFLGLDCSTQSLSGVVIDYDRRRIVAEHSVNFDADLPHYRTTNGVLPNRDPLLKHSPPLMWAEALDLLFARMNKAAVPLHDVRAVSGSGQQHGSVYLNRNAAAAVAELDPAIGLADNLRGVLSRATSPIWMDSSTIAECEEIRVALGGARATAKLTGSDVFERFTGSQIRKFYKTQREAYERTAHIALVSSFMATLVADRLAPIDYADGSGMNLMDIRNKVWHPRALKATAPQLKKKLPRLTESSHTIGPVSSYFAVKYRLNPDAAAVVWSGDNPCSAVGVGLIDEGVAAISLGTSDTFFGAMKRCRTDTRGEGHVFASPAGGYLTLICFKNGSLAREKIREQYGFDWNGFNRALAHAPVGNRGGILLPWFEPEIVPRVNRAGVHRFDLDANDVAANCRAVVEAQMMSMRLHSRWMKTAPRRIVATGGASANTAILQVMADVMNCPVSRIEISKSAALGAALRAAHGWLVQQGQKPSWNEIVRGFTDPIADSEVRPDRKAARVYDRLIEKFARCERAAVRALRALTVV